MPRLDATWITPRLYVGRRPPVGPNLRDAGFHVLVLCATPGEYEHVYGAYGRALARLFDGVSTILSPLDDSGDRAPTVEEVERAIEVAEHVADRIRGGERAIFTCMEGRNRSAFVAALTIHRLTGRSGADCAKRIRERRAPVVRKNMIREGRGDEVGGRLVLVNADFNAILDQIHPYGHTSFDPIDRGASIGGAP